MDWTNIITTLGSILLTGGGLVTLVTLKDKKYDALQANIRIALENSNSLFEQWQAVAKERSDRAEELKKDLDRKDAKIDELRRKLTEKAELIDRLNTDNALARVFICDKIGCMKRRPPFGQGSDYDLHKGAHPSEFAEEEKIMNLQ